MFAKLKAWLKARKSAVAEEALRQHAKQSAAQREVAIALLLSVRAILVNKELNWICTSMSAVVTRAKASGDTLASAYIAISRCFELDIEQMLGKHSTLDGFLIDKANCNGYLISDNRYVLRTYWIDKTIQHIRVTGGIEMAAIPSVEEFEKHLGISLRS